MRQEQVHLGNVYETKVSGVVTEVIITGFHPRGGWRGINLRTKHEVQVKSGIKLRREITESTVANVEARVEWLRHRTAQARVRSRNEAQRLACERADEALQLAEQACAANALAEALRQHGAAQATLDTWSMLGETG